MIDWNKPIEYRASPNTKYPCRLISELKTQAANTNKAIAVDWGNYETPLRIDPSGKGEGGQQFVFNVKEKKKYWTYIRLGRSGPIASTYNADQYIKVGDQFSGCTVINVLEGEYEV